MKAWWVLAIVLVSPLSAQDVSQSVAGCFNVEITSSPDESEFFQERSAFLVEFVHAPDFRSSSEAWVVPDPPGRSEARWWIEGEEMVAVWNVERRLVALRLQAEDGYLRGQVYRSLESRDREGEVWARPTACW